MSYFLSPENLFQNQTLSLTGEEAAHILFPRRMKKGEKINLQGPDGVRFVCEVIDAKKNSLDVKVLEEIVIPQEYATKVVLFQSIVSEKALDFIFQKATELGAHGITLFNSANTATKLTQDQFEKKKERWNKILSEAAKQCDRANIPHLDFLQPNGKDFINLDIFKPFDRICILDISGSPFSSTLNTLLSAEALAKEEPSPLALIIGPEGGLTKLELDKFSTIPNSELVKISPFTLRAETAALSALSLIHHL